MKDISRRRHAALTELYARHAERLKAMIDSVIHEEAEADDVLHRALGCLVEASERLDTLPDAFNTAGLSAGDAFQCALAPLAKQTLPPPADPDAVGDRFTARLIVGVHGAADHDEEEQQRRDEDEGAGPHC